MVVEERGGNRSVWYVLGGRGDVRWWVVLREKVGWIEVGIGCGGWGGCQSSGFVWGVGDCVGGRAVYRRWGVV